MYINRHFFVFVSLMEKDMAFLSYLIGVTKVYVYTKTTKNRDKKSL